MKNNLNDLIKNSVTKSTKATVDEHIKTQADILIENADKALGITTDGLGAKNKRVASVTNQTFSVTNDDISIIDKSINIFLKSGVVVNKSEIVRIGLQLVNNLNNEQLFQALKQISRRSKNGW